MEYKGELWGLTWALTEGLEGGSPVVWGARAIWKRGPHVDLLHDRQGVVLPVGLSPHEEKIRRTAFGKMINGKRLLGAWDNIPSHLDGTCEDNLTLWDDSCVCIQASPNASYGYLYVAACVKPGDDWEAYCEEARSARRAS